MNRGAIKTLAAGFANDANQTRFGAYYDTAIDLACQEFAFDSYALSKDAPTYTVVDGTASYDLPTDFWLEKQVAHLGLEIKPVSVATLLKDNGQDWTTETGTPKRYIINPEEASKTIKLVPIPQSADAGAVLVLTYYPIPVALTDDSQTPLNGSSLMSQFHMGIAAKAASLVLLNDESTAAIVSKRNQLEEMYQQKVSMAIDRFGDKAQESWALEPKRRYRQHP